VRPSLLVKATVYDYYNKQKYGQAPVTINMAGKNEVLRYRNIELKLGNTPDDSVSES
jgi:hypothetical protein